jgi:hypothetical protein
MANCWSHHITELSARRLKERLVVRTNPPYRTLLAGAPPTRHRR